MKFGHLWSADHFIRRMKVNAVLCAAQERDNATFKKMPGLFQDRFGIFAGWNFHGQVLAKIDGSFCGAANGARSRAGPVPANYPIRQLIHNLNDF